MARTRGSSGIAPVALDRQGNYVSPAASGMNPPRRIAGDKVFHGPGAEPVPESKLVMGWRCAPDTWSRNMDAFELAHLIDELLKHPGDLGGGLVLEVDAEAYEKMDANLRRHFVPVRG